MTDDLTWEEAKTAARNMTAGLRHDRTENGTHVTRCAEHGERPDEGCDVCALAFLIEKERG